MIQYPLGVGACTTRVLESGSGDQVLIFLHGVGARADRWRHNVDALADAGYHTFAVDLPGHGLASKGALPYSVPFYSQFLLDLISTVGASRATVVGTSLGGNIGAYAAVQQPERIASLVLVGTMGIVPLGYHVRAAIGTSVAERSRDGIEKKLRFVLANHQLINDAWVDEEFRVNNSPGSTEAFERLAAYFTNEVDDHVVGDQLAAITHKVPTLLVWGADDSMITTDVAVQAQSVLPDTRLAIIENTGHVPYFERPDPFNDIVHAFLTDRLSTEPTQRY